MGNTHKGTKDERDEKKLDNSYITILDSLNAQQVHHEKRIQKADSAIQKLKQNTAACELQIKNNDEKIKKLELKNKEDGLALETHKLHIIEYNAARTIAMDEFKKSRPKPVNLEPEVAKEPDVSISDVYKEPFDQPTEPKTLE